MPAKPTSAESSDVQHRDIAMVVLLTIVTLGIYWFYLCFQWSKEINGLSGQVKYQPWVVLLVNVITCGLAGVVFECLFAFDIAQAGASRGLPQRMENLATWVVVCNVAAIVVSVTGYGAVVGFLLGTVATALVQMELNKLAAIYLPSEKPA